MKTHFIKIFTISDWREEEAWLREQSKKGLKFKKINPPAGFHFEETEPEDVVYRLDFKNSNASTEMKQMYQDYGWEHCGSCMGWNYYRKPASQINSENEGELFSDNESKLSMVEHILKTRMLPLICIFLCCIMPNIAKSAGTGNTSIFNKIITLFFSILLALYLYIFMHCGSKLNKMKKELSEKKDK